MTQVKRSGLFLHVAFQLMILVGVTYGFSRSNTPFKALPPTRQAVQLSLFNGFGFNSGPDKEGEENEILLLEKEVAANVQATVDKRNAEKALVTVLSDGDSQSKPTPQWAAALAASLAAGSLSFLALQNLPVGVFVAVAVGFVASRNPIEEEDSAGAIARTVGRYTLASVEAATPKARAIARAALVGKEELAELKAHLQDLETKYTILQQENSRLRLWKERRIWVDKVLSTYSLQELKDDARLNGLQVGGTKAQLLMRLVEAEVIKPDL